MTLTIGTHSGSFHADDVLAVAMLQVFVDPHATVVRTRDLDRLAACDIIVDVGGEHDPSRGRFDHHQQTYTGRRSSAGMVLDWLEAEGHVTPDFATRLRREAVDYIDDVDNGRRSPAGDVPCLPSLVGCFNSDPGSGEDFDARFLAAVDMARRYVRGMHEGHVAGRRARETVDAAMQRATAAGRRTIEFAEYVPWKEAYFDLGGAEHPTEFVIFPAEGTWRVIAIPPHLGSFDEKRPLPEAWAGLVDEELERVTGIPGARFCHKNRFIAVFGDREGAVRGLVEAFGEEYRPV